MKVAIVGIGKTGKYLLNVVPKEDIVGPFHSKYQIKDHREEFNSADVAIIFTPSPSVDSFIEDILDFKGIVLWGVTNYNFEDYHSKIAEKKIFWLQSNNFSLAMLNLFSLLPQFAQIKSSNPLAEYFIHEIHHSAKLDAPSGTAKVWKNLIEEGTGVRLKEEISYERKEDLVGVHTLTIKLPGEEIELRHQGFARDVYAKGAYKIAQKLLQLQQKERYYGFYNQQFLIDLIKKGEL